ncbi:hypothetical protein GCK32_012635 [Trichostrongylus colubriformis]|uniref:EGF-like domain-containing protein n=1 Tax=Trichostrongylus colubriformis TaxID=6319 RepID=A0AAN8FFM7_TRICO
MATFFLVFVVILAYVDGFARNQSPTTIEKMFISTAKMTTAANKENLVDECVTNQNDCDPKAVCRDEPEPIGYTCQCRLGFTDASRDPKRPGRVCVQQNTAAATTDKSSVNECVTNQNDCDPNAICRDEPNGYQCQCRSGFTDASRDPKRPGRRCVEPSSKPTTTTTTTTATITTTTTTKTTAKDTRRRPVDTNELLYPIYHMTRAELLQNDQLSSSTGFNMVRFSSLTILLVLCRQLVLINKKYTARAIWF